MGYDLLMLLHDHYVQREVELDDQQVEAIAQIGQDYLAAARRIQPKPSPPRSVPVVAGASAAADDQRTLLKEFGESALGVLQPGQRQRLNEVMFQLQSIDIFSNPKFVAALELSAELKRKLLSVRRETEAAMRQLRLDYAGRSLDRATYEREVHSGLVAAEGEMDAHMTSTQLDLLRGWRGERISFGRMHLRLIIRGPLRPTSAN
jgi:hypothetical protein